MIEQLQVENFRSFSRFQMSGLGRLNLLVGVNNTGKTSLLEAIHVVASGVDSRVFHRIAQRRNEFFEDEGPRRNAEIDFENWLHGFDISVGRSMSIAAKGNDYSESCSLKIVSSEEVFQGRGIDRPVDFVAGPGVCLSVNNSEPHFLMLTVRGGLIPTSEWVPLVARNVRFIALPHVESSTIAAMLDEVLLNGQEELAVRAMQIIDPRIERIASTGRTGSLHVMVRLRGIKKPLPLGVLGEGINRLLVIALGLTSAANGILLLDEIDTGLHFTIMDQMWQLVNAAAEKLNVQVFATTHSRDCVESLAVVCHKDASSIGRVSIQRIEPERSRSVSVTEAEVVVIAERGIEVR